MDYKVEYINRDKKIIVPANSITKLRRILIQQYIGPMDKAKVYNDKGQLKGVIMRGYSDILWRTPKDKLYVLFKDGSFRGEY